MKLYEFNIRMIKEEFDSQLNFRDITIATFPLTLENNALSGWDGKMLAPRAESGTWSAPEIARYFWGHTNGTWSYFPSPDKTIRFSDEDPLLFKSLATGRVFMSGISLFPLFIGMGGEGIVRFDEGAWEKMSHKERRRVVNQFKWRLTNRGF